MSNDQPAAAADGADVVVIVPAHEPVQIVTPDSVPLLPQKRPREDVECAASPQPQQKRRKIEPSQDFDNEADLNAYAELFDAGLKLADEPGGTGEISVEEEMLRVEQDEKFARRLYEEDKRRLKMMEEQEKRDEELAKRIANGDLLPIAAPAPAPAPAPEPPAVDRDKDFALQLQKQEDAFTQQRAKQEAEDASYALAIQLEEEEQEKEKLKNKKLKHEPADVKQFHFVEATETEKTDDESIVIPKQLDAAVPVPVKDLPKYGRGKKKYAAPQRALSFTEAWVPALQNCFVLIVGDDAPLEKLNHVKSLLTKSGANIMSDARDKNITHIICLGDVVSPQVDELLASEKVKLLTEADIPELTKCSLRTGSDITASLAGSPVTPALVNKGLKQLSVALKMFKATKVIAIVTESLKKKFIEEYNRLTERLGPGNEGLSIAFHGTCKDRETGILSKGLVVPGSQTGVKHRTDQGCYGRGIYLSPEAGLAVGYGSSGSVFMCAVLRGRVFKVKKQIVGQHCQDGFDSHESPETPAMEWVMFKTSQVLPLYIAKLRRQ